MLQAGSALAGAASPDVVRAILNRPTSPAPAPAAAPSAPAATPTNPYDVANDPAYAQAKADEQAALDAAAASRDAAINRALIQFGSVPDFASLGKSLGLTPDQIAAITGSINSETGSLASQYTNSGDSVLGQLNQAHDQALKQLRANLAAHGTLESGATGVGVGLENQGYQHGLSQAYQTLLGNLLGYQDQYVNASNSARTALENAASSAYDRAVQLADKFPSPLPASPAATPPAGTNTSAVAGSSLAAFNNAGGVSSPAAALAARSAGLNALYGLGATKPKAAITNAYSTGQKRFG